MQTGASYYGRNFLYYLFNDFKQRPDLLLNILRGVGERLGVNGRSSRCRSRSFRRTARASARSPLRSLHHRHCLERERSVTKIHHEGLQGRRLLRQTQRKHVALVASRPSAASRRRVLPNISSCRASAISTELSSSGMMRTASGSCSSKQNT